MARSASILVVDDDIQLIKALRRTLIYAGYQVMTATNGMDALALVRDDPPDLIILDRMLPDMDGLEICSYLRGEKQELAILMLTARDAVVDRVRGLELGADDYLVKPFAQEELFARIKALLRRRHQATAQAEILRFADVELDTATRLAQRGERSIELSTTEFELLALFLRNPNIVLTRPLLLDRIWGSDFAGGPNILEVYVAHLRAKLEQAGEQRLIQTMRGTGYVLRMSNGV